MSGLTLYRCRHCEHTAVIKGGPGVAKARHIKTSPSCGLADAASNTSDQQLSQDVEEEKDETGGAFVQSRGTALSILS